MTLHSGRSLDQWVEIACHGNPAHPIDYAIYRAEVCIQAGLNDEARVWKAVVERLQDELSKPLPTELDEPEQDDPNSSPVF